MGIHSEKARKFFKEGYNCAQAVFLSFCDDAGLGTETAAKLSAPFGGGMGRLREVCGAVTGMFLAAGMTYGYGGSMDKEQKEEHYRFIQSLGNTFKEQYGSIICRELLKLPLGSESPGLETRNATYHTCEDFVGSAADILEKYMEENR